MHFIILSQGQPRSSQAKAFHYCLGGSLSPVGIFSRDQEFIASLRFKQDPWLVQCDSCSTIHAAGCASQIGQSQMDPGWSLYHHSIGILKTVVGERLLNSYQRFSLPDNFIIALEH